MAKVRVRADTKKLFIDFRYQGIRCREQTLLSDTARNRKQLETLIQRMEAKMLVGGFDYAEFFPGSKNLKKLEEAGALPRNGGGILGQSETITPLFADFADQWFLESKIQWRNSHTRNVESILASSLKPAFKDKRVGEISKPDILAARNKMARRKGRGASGLMAPKTINSHMTILRMILTEAAERFDFTNPYLNIKPLKQQRVHIEPFSLNEVEKILETVREDYHNYYLVRFYTGMRTGEVDGLKWEYVDFEKREILVRETLIHGQTEYTKTDGSQREIPMFGPVYQALKSQYEATGKLSKFVFCNRLGEPLDHNNVTKRVWYPLLEHLKLKKRRPYQTRHTAATLLLASGENPEWVARTLGHSSTEMLFKVYSRYIPNLTRMDGSAFERLIQSRVIENDKEVGDETE
ncbi:MULTISPECIES: tyrosine-type recombinase/integrase [Marinobacter]|jgi:integrase|uniref:Site-specific integrase n=2 Tax=Marinobacter TaxID=2742 RepID=A0A7Z1ILZ7_9GAMM|nr:MULTISPECIES: tyrosine-type recombinase/integrase [Marinobacter]MCE0760882.1 site-specific integrase [Marinobacter sp. G11]OZC35740.1 site-specific integrase [Marinobacter vinifirmus]|tara:strand:- start:3218 stop:4441 length:1224 start_codon:yes stop_codon:yes gene_type:complete